MLVWLGFIGYYLASLLDFMGLAYITAALERLVLFLYPTMVVLLSALLRGKPITRRDDRRAGALLWRASRRLRARSAGSAGDARALWTGGALVFASAFLYALYLVGAGDVIARLGSMRFIAWAMLASAVFVVRAVRRSRATSRACACRRRSTRLSLAMAMFSTVLPTWLIAEAIRRIGANASSLVGSLGPVFTIGLGALILGEPVHAIQLAGAALVLAASCWSRSNRAPSVPRKPPLLHWADAA